MASGTHMFNQASNVRINGQPVFNTADTVHNNFYGTTSQTANNGQVIPVSKVLECPSPSEYFVGREDVLSKLSKIFSAPAVTLWGTNMDVLRDFVRQNLKYSLLFLDASSGQALAKSVADINKDALARADALLVLQSAHAPVDSEDLHTLPYAPVLVITTQSSSPFHLPNGANQQVVHKLLHSIERVLNARRHVVTLVANGGTGKTQAVLKFVSENSSRFSNVWFFDASSHDTLTANFKDLGKAAGVGEDFKDVRDFLTRTSENWLCIFDNADDDKVYLNDYVPICNRGDVIVTSRLSETSQMASPDCHIDLMDLTKESAVELLLNRAHKQSSNENLNWAFKIVEALDCHALAVSTAGAYIGATPTCTLQNYLTHFNKKKKKILNYRMRTLDSYQRTVYSAFHLSFEKLSHPTQLLMQICGYLNQTAIPLKIFTQAAAFTCNDSSTVDIDPPIKAINFMKEFLLLFKDEDSWEDCVIEMCQLSLASYNVVKKCLDFHAVIHTCVQESTECPDVISQTAILLLARATPPGKTNEEYQFCRQLLIHASHVWQVNTLPTVHAKICLAKVFGNNGFWTYTEDLEDKVLSVHRQVLGEHHPDTLRAMADLAGTYRALGKLEAAEKLEEEVLPLRKQLLGEHHPDTLMAMANLAATYRVLGKLKAAEKLEEEVLPLHKQLLGEHHPDTLTAMANLAATYRALGKLEAAEKLAEEVLPLCKQLLGEHHLDTLRAMANLAATYQALGKLEAAEKLAEEVLPLHKQLLGEHHPDTLRAMANLAGTYHALGKLEAAEKLEEEVLPLCKQLLGEHHPDTLTAMANLAATYRALGKLEAAEKMAEEVLPLCKQLLGEHHPDTLIAMSNLAVIYHALGWLEAAEKLEEEVLLLRKQLLGEHHPDTLIAMTNLAAIYRALGKLEAAEKLAEEVLPLCKQLLGEHHPDTLRAMTNLAATYRALGKLEAAEKMAEEVLPLCKQLLGEHHLDTLRATTNLAGKGVQRI
ncbi:TPR-like protein [Gymnopus androsaceus JB14]|uniref:TPR-like protein n=1 Tax=Gymnopus androsaceus JB14 TaxID=1447944 RepID=A0A6A4H2J8_9AGAR|nr:TPR-like protein [Gymnopus androsaceus JB14]